jgi:hypothetical protein
MATFPALSSNSTAVGTPQKIESSIRGQRLGLGSTGVLITQPENATVAYPLKPEAGAMITATTADTIGNYGGYKLNSTAVSAIFTLAAPVPNGELTLVLNANPSTAVKFVTSSSNVTFSSSANSNSLTLGSSLFFDGHTLTLVGMGSTGYRVKSWYTQTGSSISPTPTT